MAEKRFQTQSNLRHLLTEKNLYMPIRYGKKKKNTRNAKIKTPFVRRDGILFKNSRTTSHAYEESVLHVKSFGAVVGKNRYVVLTYHDVLTQLLQRELRGNKNQSFHNFHLAKAETLFRKQVPLKPNYVHCKGERIEVGWTCDKKKTQKWFKQNINRMLGN